MRAPVAVEDGGAWCFVRVCLATSWHTRARSPTRCHSSTGATWQYKSPKRPGFQLWLLRSESGEMVLKLASFFCFWKSGQVVSKPSGCGGSLIAHELQVAQKPCVGCEMPEIQYRKSHWGLQSALPSPSKLCRDLNASS